MVCNPSWAVCYRFLDNQSSWFTTTSQPSGFLWKELIVTILIRKVSSATETYCIQKRSFVSTESEYLFFINRKIAIKSEFRTLGPFQKSLKQSISVQKRSRCFVWWFCRSLERRNCLSSGHSKNLVVEKPCPSPSPSPEPTQPSEQDAPCTGGSRAPSKHALGKEKKPDEGDLPPEKDEFIDGDVPRSQLPAEGLRTSRSFLPEDKFPQSMITKERKILSRFRPRSSRDSHVLYNITRRESLIGK